MARAEITGRKPSQSAGQSRRRPGKPKADPNAIEAMRHREPKQATTGKRPPTRGPPVSPHAFTVLEFCTAHRISRARYYELKQEGLAPVEMIIGRRRLISFEAAARWRRDREAAAAAPAA
jgi:hypothetical protein